MEAELERHREHLEELVEQRTEELRRAADDLARSNRDLEQFAYVASHDLQEPLRMVSSYVQLLARRYEGKLDAEADKFIGYAVDGAARMRRLIDDLLAYSRVGTRGRALAPVDAAAALGDAMKDLAGAVDETGASVTCDELPRVLGDRTQLARLFQNLIGNAIKFREPARPCRVHVSAGRDGGLWLFRVRDNGIGIEPQYLEKVFQIFQRLHDRTTYPGTGVGLPICRRIVERHGGRIWVESQPGEGSVFCFTLRAEGATK